MTSRPAHAFTLALLILSGCAGKPIRRSYDFPGIRKDYPEETVFVSSPKPRVPDKDRLPKELPSFCKLNPEACPDLIEKFAPPKRKPAEAKPPSPKPEKEEGPEGTGDPKKRLACQMACKAGGAAMAGFCGALPDRTDKQRLTKRICREVSEGSTEACLVFCQSFFGRPRSPDP